MSRYCLYLLFLLGLLPDLKADSPLTSTNPAMAYQAVPEVAKELADGTHTLSKAECAFLFSAKNPLDHKFAFINALSWGDTTHVETYVQYLMQQYRLPHTVFDSILAWRGTQPGAYAPAALLKADDYACLAYLQAMGDYFRPLCAYYCAYHAVDMKPESGAAAYIIGLVMAQFYLDSDWCKVYEVMHGIKDHEGFTEDILLPAAIANIFEYIDIYQQSCLEKEMSKGEVPDNEYHKPAAPQYMEDKKNYVDLAVVSISAPEYIADYNGSRVVVKVKNRGTISSISTNARLSDLYITYQEAKKKKFSKEWLQVLQDNIDADFDNDQNWEVMVKIPVLQPGEEIELVFQLKNYWVYDPNCEIQVELDQDQNIEELLEDNNTGYFLRGG